MLPNFFDLKDQPKLTVAEGDTLSLGVHTLQFFMAPMVHWPEVMVEYEQKEKILFSADGFGKFGALDTEEPWEEEARRYYYNIVGKYGAPVQTLLKKAAKLDIAKICPLHGTILTENLGYYLEKYNLWSTYQPEEHGILIAHASIHGNTAKAAELLADLLLREGETVAVVDLARDDMAEAVANAFQYDRMVLAAASYDELDFPNTTKHNRRSVMQSILPWVGIVILFLTGWAVVKKYQVNMVLLLGGLALNILAVAGGLTSFLPKNAAATGFVGFDFMELLRAISRTQIAGVGFIILVSGGFAEYMKAIGASDRFVTVCAKPLSLIKNPYLILAAVFIFGHCLGLIITSAAGLAMLMVVTVYPLIIRVGCSSLAAAAVVASVLAIGYAPASGVAVMAAELVHLDPIQYLVQYQLPMAVPTILAMAVAHVVVQWWFDKHDNIKGETADLQELEEKRKVLENVPAIYAVLPIIPIVLLLIFNKMVYQSITLNVATAMFIAWVLSFFVDLVVRRDAKKSFDLSFAMFKGMGSILTSTVGLIFVAAFFATGLQNIGIVNMLIEGAKHIGLGETGTGVFLSAVIGVVTVLTGSGVAAFTSLAHIIPDVAAHLNSDGISIMLMMHTASEMLRAISPVAGVVIIVAGFAKVNPLTMVKRTAIPCLVGYVTMLITVTVMF